MFTSPISAKDVRKVGQRTLKKQLSKESSSMVLNKPSSALLVMNKSLTPIEMYKLQQQRGREMSRRLIGDFVSSKDVGKHLFD